MIFRRGFWDLPKGKLDEGESIEECAVREVEEETGLKNVQLKEFLGITKHEYFDRYSTRDVIKETHWYRMFASQNEILIPQTEEDIQKIEWVATKELGSFLKQTYSNIVEIVEKWRK